VEPHLNAQEGVPHGEVPPGGPVHPLQGRCGRAGMHHHPIKLEKFAVPSHDRALDEHGTHIVVGVTRQLLAGATERPQQPDRILIREVSGRQTARSERIKAGKRDDLVQDEVGDASQVLRHSPGDGKGVHPVVRSRLGEVEGAGIEDHSDVIVLAAQCPAGDRAAAPSLVAEDATHARRRIGPRADDALHGVGDGHVHQ
jgi:hypothetical protein